ncbi:NAD-dependent epimerase/dehydratase family protein [Kitasatospora sp. NBC_01287]|uniref:NAD-dependent epimerase/dehydratase family protein n=1 Tax=Kitasatospora sp. NBC_01287 TaxID=2903573 RepID=UPI002250CF94|nr:NAD-dependent epimerase/dehydratase family protein [Kitasatospora sp. NBC_01287]MCX4751168.1 NAD-dependent epimerase/dehydratase family protein [Kitasatospora sp. NBC_01287]
MSSDTAAGFGKIWAMKILIIGGTWFLGRAVVRGALDRGWAVTTFNRGRSGRDLPGVEAIHGDRTDPGDLARLASHGPWDAVIDTSAGEQPPRTVLAGAQTLEPVAERYAYISTASVYAGWPDHPLSVGDELLDGPPDADEDYGRNPPGWLGPNLHYGRQKAGAERAVLAAFGEHRSWIVRPGVILGPGEYVGRLPWWLNRAERGGRILAPGKPTKGIQPVDVRDVAEFALDLANRPGGGVHNATGPIGRDTMGQLLQTCLDVTASSGQLEWVGDEVLLDHGVEQWTELPLWRTHEGVWLIDSGSAYEAGLVCRPLAETVTDTWAWLQSGHLPVPHPRAAAHGIDPVKEAAILSAISPRP